MSASTYSRRSRLIALAVVVVVAGAAIAGVIFAVADGGAPAYKGLAGRYAAVTSTLRQESDALRTPAGATAPADRPLFEVLRVYDALRAATEKARDGYEALEVPESMTPAKRRLADAISARVAILRRLIHAAETGDQATAAQAVRDLLESAAPVNAAQVAMAKRITDCGSRCR
jgi:hypothetical protein